ncbi:uncharacterized protein BDCG_01738 [Blastomyces dermatitidis ER-3]|uniref:Uncharacterized protein n=1 Tax=Ajellomyces dermatitidis (strain ER-3 / ATCC MYA-2586) TaxID=559297 RepID=A0ABP2ES97_AJEDR|nr:uncharacterized protein BDCG_01738 [Blastomyces dermatitidis ER-3]EEQ86618.2 hypothetical protein BDCG_01738 [Blastomyces dermatitidis ER-3]
MPRNARRPAASQARTKTPTLRLSLLKLPVPEVPDNGEDPVNDEMEEQVDEEDIETQLYERVIINGIKDSVKTKYRTVSANDPTISFFHIQYTAEKMTEEYIAKQICKEVEVVDHTAVITSYKHGFQANKITIEKEEDWKEIIGLLKELYKKKMSDLIIEVISSFNLLDISTLSSNTSVIHGPAAFIEVPDSQLATQALASKRALDVKEDTISPSCDPHHRPAKSPRIHEISDDEKPSTHSRITATSQQLKKV